MKRAIVISLMGVCVAAMLAVAATNEVSSVNAVGYIKLSMEADKFYMVTPPLDALGIGTNAPTLNDVLGTDFPMLSKAYTHDGVSYSGSTFVGTWSPNLELDRGMGLWVKSPAAKDLVLMGEVPTQDETVYVAPGFQLIGYPFPVTQTLNDTVLASVAQMLDKVYLWDPDTGYAASTFVGTWSPNLTLEPGQAYWYSSAGSTNGVETVPYSL